MLPIDIIRQRLAVSEKARNDYATFLDVNNLPDVAPLSADDQSRLLDLLQEPRQ